MAFTRQALGPNFNEGARLLWLAIAATPKGSVRKANEAAGATAGMAIRWLYGDQKPGTRFRVKLQEHFGVPIGSWDEAPTEDFVVPAKREAADAEDIEIPPVVPDDAEDDASAQPGAA